MKKSNQKGFTLIELLAVIVILGVLLAIAVPSVTKYINTSKKNTYISNAQSYASTALQQTTLGTYKAPVNPNEAIVIFFSALEDDLEKGGKTSPYGGAYTADSSFVVIANVRTAENPKYQSYIAAIDSEGYGIGSISASTATAQIIEYNSLTSANIIQVSPGVTKPTENSTIKTADNQSFKVVKVYAK